MWKLKHSDDTKKKERKAVRAKEILNSNIICSNKRSQKYSTDAAGATAMRQMYLGRGRDDAQTPLPPPLAKLSHYDIIIIN